MSNLNSEEEQLNIKNDSSLTFEARTLKRRKMECIINTSGYMYIRFIPTTSNVCERLMATAGYALSSYRLERTLPI